MISHSCDVAIIGGAVIGSSVAFWLTKLAPDLRVTVIERDPGYVHASSALSASAIRQQYSNPLNVRISQFGAEVIRDWEALVGPDAPELGFRENGYLYCVPLGDPDGMRARAALQCDEGASTVWFDRDALSDRFGFLETSDLAGGSWGARGEGWFDGYGLMQGFRRAAQRAGARFLTDEVVGLDARAGRIVLRSGDAMECGRIVNAAGPGAGRVAALAGIDLPVEPRKRDVFVFDCATALPPDMPNVIDPSGLYVRPEGAGFLAGMPPEQDGPCDPDDFETDHGAFEDRLWPVLAARIPAFEAIRLRGYWTGHYDFNPFDHNAIIGAHPEFGRLIFANGFSGHGLQQAPAAGRAVAELICHGGYRTLDLSAFSFERIALGARFAEEAVI